jgi:hypothetical protein
MRDDDADEPFSVTLQRLLEAAGSPSYSDLVEDAARESPPITLTPQTLSAWFTGKVKTPKDNRAREFLITRLEDLARRRAPGLRSGEADQGAPPPVAAGQKASAEANATWTFQAVALSATAGLVFGSLQVADGGPLQKGALFLLSTLVYLFAWRAFQSVNWRRGAIVLASLSFLTMVVVVVLVPPPSTPPVGPIASQPSSTPTSAAPTLSAPVAPKLDIKQDYLRSSGNAWYVAFPKGVPVVATAELPTSEIGMDSWLRTKLVAGGYLLTVGADPITLSLNVRNPLKQPIIIRGLVVEKKTNEPIISGTALKVESGGNNEAPIRLHLDAAYPTARLESKGEDARPYFEEKSVLIQPAGTAVLPIAIDASKSAHTFVLTLKFDMAGKNYQQTIDNGGQPFRVSPTVCASRAHVPGLTDLEQKDAAALRYDRVLTMDYGPDGKPALLPKDPKADAESC